MKHILLVTALLTTPAFAQQPDPLFSSRVLTAIQTQRNQAWDAAAVAEAQIVKLTEDLRIAQLKIKELEAKLGEKKE